MFRTGIAVTIGPDTLYKGFRNPEAIRALAQTIARQSEKLTEPLRIMEVCGGHTHTIMKYGLTQLLPPSIEFIHGPGCPVCIIPKERIDHAIALSRMDNTILLTLGDMIRVPGSTSSLSLERAAGRDIRPLYSPLDALRIARENPEKRVVFFAIGFETTTPMSASLILQAQKEGIENLFFHINHVLVPPPVHMIMRDPLTRINAFIGPAHVSVITGSHIYEPLAAAYGTPIVVSGFEPVDVMEGILRLVRQKNDGRAEVEIQYSRAVTREGNIRSQEMIDRAFETRASFRWRGIGDIPYSALKLRGGLAHRDAEEVFAEFLPNDVIDDHRLCICGSILRGLAKPHDCSVFGTACTPSSPLGSCMVSSEGACNAYYRYGKSD